MNLADEFIQLAAAHCQNKSPELISIWWEKIERCYSENQRYYHTLTHLESMWSQLGALILPGGGIQDGDISVLDARQIAVFQFAILFHDIVYDPKSHHGQNELESIRIFKGFSEQLNLAQDLCDDVCNLIEATIGHAKPQTYPASLPLFLDIDLEVLGRSREHYAIYAEQIRQEYCHLSATDYRAGRVKVLQRLNGSDQVYFTKYWHDRCNDQAKANMTWEIDQLTKQAHVQGN